jgi:hypothetical protein
MEEFIKIPGKGKYQLKLLVELLDYLRSVNWKFGIWKFSPALVDKDGGTIRQYNGQKFDEKYFELVKMAGRMIIVKFVMKKLRIVIKVINQKTMIGFVKVVMNF